MHVQGMLQGYDYKLDMTPTFAAELLRTLPYCQEYDGSPCSTWVNGSTTSAIVLDFAYLDPYGEQFESVTSCTIVVENPLDSKVSLSSSILDQVHHCNSLCRCTSQLSAATRGALTLGSTLYLPCAWFCTS